MKKEKRPYSMSTRAESATQTEQSIMHAMVALWMEIPLSQITLEKIAERAGVTVRTILRKFGSKEDLLEASLQHDASTIEQTRNKVPVGDVAEALNVLLTEYEQMGEAVVRTIVLENELPGARKILDRGRAYHRQWCALVFEPYLPDSGSDAYEIKLAAFIAATEIYLWKLLRKDLQKSHDETRQVFRLLVEGLIRSPHP
ncbi:hypothetical protein GCM10023189_33840 [Nibrella saemangeumensis]|uniref:HTH tetR-type domain-containing protein n=1 Tax=Nibrella saemangeumensis TaxID=1084526 RepID=A0ABP8N1L9_9BACT